LDWVHYTVNWLQESQTTVYTVDPRGLEVAPGWLAVDFGSAIVPQTRPTLSDLIFESLAPESGGTIFRWRNDVDVAIATALRDGFSSYTLSYYPSDSNWDSAFRRIRVVVNRSGLTARTQSGYYAFPEGFEGGTAQIDFGLSRAVTSPIPFRSVAFTATGQILPPSSAQTVPPSQKRGAAPHVAKSPATSPVTFRLVLAIHRDSLSWTQQPTGDKRSEITVVTSCIGSSGRVLGYRVREAEVVLEKSKLRDPAGDSIQLFVLPRPTTSVSLSAMPPPAISALLICPPLRSPALKLSRATFLGLAQDYLAGGAPLIQQLGATEHQGMEMTKCRYHVQRLTRLSLAHAVLQDNGELQPRRSAGNVYR
jgi:hypothetical protein